MSAAKLGWSIVGSQAMVWAKAIEHHGAANIAHSVLKQRSKLGAKKYCVCKVNFIVCQSKQKGGLQNKAYTHRWNKN
jgi:hypothetical protein